MDFERMTDEELALRARRDPRGPFEVLFERHRGALYAFILRQGIEEGRAEDLFQQVFLKAFRALPSFREEARFKTWLYAIAVHAVQDERRAERRRGSAVPLHEAMAVDGPRAHEEAERAEDVGRVKRALEGAPPHHRLLFTLVRFQGLPLAEAAPLVGMSAPTAKLTLFRISKRIGELLAPVRET